MQLTLQLIFKAIAEMTLSLIVASRKFTLLILLFATIVSRAQSLIQARSHQTSRLVGIPSLSRVSYVETSLDMASTGYDLSKSSSRMEGPPHVETVLFVECGFGNDSHGEFQCQISLLNLRIIGTHKLFNW